MPQAAMLVLAGTETKADLGRVVNVLQIVRELDEFDGHPSVRKLISNGYQILTF